MTSYSRFSQSQSGKTLFFSPDKIEDSEICIDDIAVGLMSVPRFNGQQSIDVLKGRSGPYTVGEHSLIGSHAPELRNDPALQMEFLLHDASEAYIGDVITPIKKLVEAATDVYATIEARLQETILKKLGVYHLKSPPAVKVVDTRMLITERGVVQPHHTKNWAVDKQNTVEYPVDSFFYEKYEVLKTMTHAEKVEMFLLRFFQLKSQLVDRPSTFDWHSEFYVHFASVYRTPPFSAAVELLYEEEEDIDDIDTMEMFSFVCPVCSHENSFESLGTHALFEPRSIVFLDGHLETHAVSRRYCESCVSPVLLLLRTLHRNNQGGA